jgi:lysophospholipase L1-like esterase
MLFQNFCGALRPNPIIHRFPTRLRYRSTTGLTTALSLIVTAACFAAPSPDSPTRDKASETQAQVDENSGAEAASKPIVLVLGDSISMGYTPFLRTQLADVANVVRPMFNETKPENCSGTLNGVAKVDGWIEKAGKPDVITFNFGLHDLKRETQGAKRAASGDPADPPQSDPETYRQNLTQIVAKLEATGAKLFCVTTTPVPPGKLTPHRDPGDPLLYNAIARQVVQSRGIEVIDLYGPVMENPDWQRPVNVHFTEAGSEALATIITKKVQPILSNLDQAKSMQVAARNATSWQPADEDVERASKNRPFNYRESDVPSYKLPDPLLDGSGNRVTAQQWPAHRQSTLQTFRDHFYGNVPVEAAQAKVTYTPVAHYDSTNLIARRVEARITAGGSDFTFPFLLYLPKSTAASDAAPVPVVVVIHNREFPDLAKAVERPSPFLPVEAIIKRGYAVAVFHTSDVDPDKKDGFDQGIRGFFARAKLGPSADILTRQPSDWGAIAAWAWGASRVLDHLITLPEIDASRIAVIGHSRGGKTAAWAAAQDTRFAAAFVNESGCGGAALSRRRFGETIARITTAFPHWFCKKLDDYADAEDKLPIDQHQLFGLIAPRAVAVGSAAEDLWADPRGEYLSVVHAAPVYELLGKSTITDPEMPPLAQPRFVGPTGYFVRPGEHNLQEDDWANYLDFFDGQSK